MSENTAPTQGGRSERSDAAYEATWGWRPPLPLEEVPSSCGPRGHGRH